MKVFRVVVTTELFISANDTALKQARVRTGHAKVLDRLRAIGAECARGEYHPGIDVMDEDQDITVEEVKPVRVPL